MDKHSKRPVCTCVCVKKREERGENILCLWLVNTTFLLPPTIQIEELRVGGGSGIKEGTTIFKINKHERKIEKDQQTGPPVRHCCEISFFKKKILIVY